MSGHHPPSSWNHHPMQVPPYIPRQLPMAHMSNERPIGGGSWHNSGLPSAGGPQMPLNTGPLGPDHNQYPYIPANNRKHTMDMNPMLPPQFSRHPLPADYDSPMMDLSVSSTMRNNQFAGEHQDYSSKMMMMNSSSRGMGMGEKDSCDGPLPMLPSNGTQVNSDKSGSIMDLGGYPTNDILNRRQNPVGLPPMPEPMELVKEAFLKTIKSHVTAMSSDLNAGFIHSPPPDGMDLSCEGSGGGGGNNDVKSGDSENTTASTVSAQSRRKTRKPNKTSKVLNEGALASIAGRSSTEGELEASPGEEHKLVAEDEKTQEAEKTASPNKRQSQDTPEKEKENHGVDSVKKRRSNRRSNDSAANQSSDEVTPSVAAIKDNDVPVALVVPSKEVNGGETPSQNGKGEEKAAAVDPDASFEDVENKLTEMFAGIADTKEEGLDEGKRSKSVEPLPTTEQAKPPNTTKRKATPGRRNSICLSMLISDRDIEDSGDEDFALAPQKSKKRQRKTATTASKKGASNGTGGTASSSTGGNSQQKKKGGKAGASNNNKKKKKATKWDDDAPPTTTTNKKSSKDPEESRYRGPLLQVRQDGSLGVLNGPQSLAEDDQDARSGAKAKKFLHNGADRNKVIRGLHASTLSMKYDTDRTDTTWICVFCKLGPHKMGLGDLFGPYMATTDCDEFRLMQAHAGDLFKSNRSRLDMLQMAPHRLPVVPAMGSAAAAALAALKSPNSKMASPAKRGPKKKQQPVVSTVDGTAINSSESNADLYLGLTRATENSFEIWMHEDCIVWGSGIHMIAGRLMGVEEAVWGSTSSQCSLCKKGGAVVCCLQRGCSDKVHLPCGRQSNWLLVEEVLNSYCQVHRASREGEVASSSSR